MGLPRSLLRVSSQWRHLGTSFVPSVCFQVVWICLGEVANILVASLKVGCFLDRKVASNEVSSLQEDRAG